MRNLLIWMAAVLALAGCQKKGPAYSTGEWLSDACGPPLATMGGARFQSEGEVQSYLKDNHIVLVADFPRAALFAALYDFRFRLPAGPNRMLIDKKVEMRLLWGKSVLYDPAFNAYHSKYFGEADHSRIRDAAGIAYTWGATVLVNHLVGESPSVLLHERAHNVDQNFTGGRGYLSAEPEWLKAFEEPRLKTVLKVYCGPHCGTPIEAFAETYAMYHACPKSRAILEGAPKTLAYLKSLDERLR